MHKALEILVRNSIRKNKSEVSDELYLSAKNDEERAKFALQNLSRYEEPIKHERQCKNAAKACEYIEQGNKSYRSLQWSDSIEKYTKAVSHAEIDSKELSRAYGNRSAALYDGGLYDDSLIDIERALKIGYNDDTKAKLYARRAKCIFAIKKNMTPEVIKALTDARKWLGKMNDISKTLLLNFLNKFPKNLPIRKPLKKPMSSKLIPKIRNDNPNILGASGAVALKYSTKYGRYVVATRNINVGEVIMAQKPYVNTISNGTHHKYCANCCKKVWSGIPCHQCVNAIYCDENCRDEAWREYHDIECLVTSAIDGNAEQKDLLTLRLTIKAYKEAGSFEKLQGNIKKIDAINDPILKGLTNNVFDSTKYASVYSLWRKTTVLSEHAFQAALILHSLAATTEIFGEKILTFEKLLMNKWAKFMGGFILTNHRIISMNGIHINHIDGLNVNPFWSLFNHSCDPSTIAMNCGDIDVLITTQKIKKGEQIFVTYGPIFQLDEMNERRKLYEKFDFLCDCTACIKKWGPESLSTFPSFGISDSLVYPDLAKKLLNFGIYNEQFEMVHTDFDGKLEMMQRIYDLLNSLQTTHGYPSKEIFLLRLHLFRFIDSVLNSFA